MSANDIVDQFIKFGILSYILTMAGPDFGFWDKEELACYLTYVPQEDIIERLLGSKDEYTKMYNEKLNEHLKEQNELYRKNV